MKAITTRIEDKYFEDLKRIEKEEQTERAEVMRKLLASAIKEWKTKKALELLKEHKITIRKTVKLTGASYIEMLDLASKADINIGYSAKELRKDLEK